MHAHFAQAENTIQPLDYLVAHVCPDGNLPMLQPCAVTHPQKARDRILWRRHDWPPPDGYQIEDTFIEADGQPALIWTYPPFGPVDPANGDGGELYKIDHSGMVTITATQDGGKPYLQHFVGESCGGTGWIAFSASAASGRWTEKVARLADGSDPGACDYLNEAYTRWKLEDVPIPFIIRGQKRLVTVSTILSEHYDGPSIARSRHVERSFFGRGYGRLVWEVWGTTPPTVPDLAERCPLTPFSLPPARGWQLEDCRYATNLVAAEGRLTGARLGWPR